MEIDNQRFTMQDDEDEVPMEKRKQVLYDRYKDTEGQFMTEQEYIESQKMGAAMKK